MENFYESIDCKVKTKLVNKENTSVDKVAVT